MKHLQIYRLIAEVARCGSIRKTADQIHITPSALTRKIQDFESELGTPVFERLPQGMRLNAVGELLVQYIQDHNSGFELLRSQISDLSGVRRGHVKLACAQAFIDEVLPVEISKFRKQFPHVTFSVDVRDNAAGVDALINYEADLALLIDPPKTMFLEVLHSSKQPLCAVMRKSHPLANKDIVRLKDCCDYPIAMPGQSLAIRVLLDYSLHRLNLNPHVTVESGSLEFLKKFVIKEPAISFLPLSAIPQEDKLICFRPINPRDVAELRVVFVKLKGRTLSSAADQFVKQLPRWPLQTPPPLAGQTPPGRMG